MEHVKEVIVVEGRYDKNALSQVVDAVILETSGFGIFKDSQKQKLFRTLAETKGLIVLTDSDGAGFVIRNFVKGFTDPKTVPFLRLVVFRHQNRGEGIRNHQQIPAFGNLRARVVVPILIPVGKNPHLRQFTGNRILQQFESIFSHIIRANVKNTVEIAVFRDLIQRMRTGVILKGAGIIQRVRQVIEVRFTERIGFAVRVGVIIKTKLRRGHMQAGTNIAAEIFQVVFDISGIRIGIEWRA